MITSLLGNISILSVLSLQLQMPLFDQSDLQTSSSSSSIVDSRRRDMSLINRLTELSEMATQPRQKRAIVWVERSTQWTTPQSRMIQVHIACIACVPLSAWEESTQDDSPLQKGQDRNRDARLRSKRTEVKKKKAIDKGEARSEQG